MATVSFVDSLPVGLENVRWQVVAPSGGMEGVVEAIRRGNELYFDVAITREERDTQYQALIRVLPNLVAGIEPDNSRERVFHLNKASAFFLDLDGNVTENLVSLRIVITTEVTQPDLSAGYVVMWPETEHSIATAS